MASGNRITLLGLHPQSERPFEILSSEVPGLEREDVYIDIDDEVDCQIDNGSILQYQAMESVEEKEIDDRGSSSMGSSNSDNVDRRHHRNAKQIKNSQLESKPKEEVVGVQFIFDWIPSYLLVISKVHKKPNKTPINSPKSK